MTNSTIDLQLSHRSIRKFTSQPVEEEQLRQLLQVAQRTATSSNMQACSIVQITDPQIKQAMAEVAKQPYIAQAPVLWQTIVDTQRLERIVHGAGSGARGAASMDLFLQGFTDACLLTQNVGLAATSLGLGYCFLGSPLNNPQKVIDLLELPQLTFPVLGIMLGHPDQDPALKPRLDMGVRVYQNRYRAADDEAGVLAAYDAEMGTYYDLRDTANPVPAYTKQVVSRLGMDLPGRHQVLRAVAAQGFDLALS